MTTIRRIDPTQFVFDIHRDLSVEPRRPQPGPPLRIDGMTVGIVDLTEDAPHDGEMHPDGDEILYVISGGVRIACDSAPDAPFELRPGEACIMPKGEWHKVTLLVPTRLLYITPGPNGEHRPLENA